MKIIWILCSILHSYKIAPSESYLKLVLKTEDKLKMCNIHLYIWIWYEKLGIISAAALAISRFNCKACFSFISVNFYRIMQCMWDSKKSAMDILLAPFILLSPPGVDDHESAIKRIWKQLRHLLDLHQWLVPPLAMVSEQVVIIDMMKMTKVNQNRCHIKE